MDSRSGFMVNGNGITKLKDKSKNR